MHLHLDYIYFHSEGAAHLERPVIKYSISSKNHRQVSSTVMYKCSLVLCPIHNKYLQARSSGQEEYFIYHMAVCFSQSQFYYTVMHYNEQNFY